jgi:hypothetical protein
MTTLWLGQIKTLTTTPLGPKKGEGRGRERWKRKSTVLSSQKASRMTITMN